MEQIVIRIEENIQIIVRKCLNRDFDTIVLLFDFFIHRYN